MKKSINVEFFNDGQDAFLDACIDLQMGRRHQEEQLDPWTLISELTVESRSVNVRFKILEIENPRRVTSRSSGRTHQVANCIVGDESAVITLTLWNYDIDEIETGKVFELINGYIKVYNESMQLGKGRWGEFRAADTDIMEVNSGLDMSKPYMGRPKSRRQRERSPTGRTFSGIAGRESRGYPSRKGF